MSIYDEEESLVRNPVKLWEYSHPKDTKCWKFIQYVNQQHSTAFQTYDELYNWSVEQTSLFWKDVWDFTGVISSSPATAVVEYLKPMYPRPRFFVGAKLSYAQNLLYPISSPDEASTAVISVTEFGLTKVSWKDLREQVRKVSLALIRAGVHRGDRIAGYVSNNVTTLVALLATSAIGAVWSSTSSEIGAVSVVERLSQIEPVVLFADNASIYNQKKFDNLPKVSEIVQQLPCLRTVVIVETANLQIDLSLVKPKNGLAFTLDAFIADVEDGEIVEFVMLDFDDPLFIVYSSGTTGKPKCIVHGQGGSLLQHKKEHAIQMDMSLGDVFFQYTTCSWMMWQWLISGLASGATVVLYDGSPFQPHGDDSMFKLIDDLEVKYFGTSAKYLSILEQKKYNPRLKFAMKKLAAITSTGSVLSPSTFSYVYDTFGSILLGSITGGTDILSLFGAPSFLNPVYKGEVQVRGLGMAVHVMSPNGDIIDESGKSGDLVCTRVFPCMPVRFWNDADGAKYESSYFERFGRNIWHHGDFVVFSPKTRGLVMLGRSDGVLKPSGVRFGSSEIYNVLNQEFPTEIDDALCVGMTRPSDLDETVVLFVKMHHGVEFNSDLEQSIRSKIRIQLSARHVPKFIDQTPEIPYTANGKKVETVVKKIVSNSPLSIGASVANPDCLLWYKSWADRH
ncbi:uncharacterized protein V1516DRAFT_664443 [Lipomyces oligophaga]|uniref:uncharacterized protein n=1 Tax=Lipomyces oligophaga TaxID=45792 RepID=UPI0034CD1DBC